MRLTEFVLDIWVRTCVDVDEVDITIDTSTHICKRLSEFTIYVGTRTTGLVDGSTQYMQAI